MKRLLPILTLTMVYSQSFAQTVGAKFKDKSVNQIELGSPQTIETTFGQGKNYIDPSDNETEVINGDGKQLLTMFFYPGGTTNDFYAFRIS